jgi:hypothetical protein
MALATQMAVTKCPGYTIPFKPYALYICMDQWCEWNGVLSVLCRDIGVSQCGHPKWFFPSVQETIDLAMKKIDSSYFIY